MVEYKVTAEVLKRFHAGLSSPEEQAAVECWLEEGDDEILPSHTEEEEEEIGRQLWAAVGSSTIYKKKNKSFGYYGYGIAASLLLAACTIFYFQNRSGNSQQQQLVSIKNSTGNRAKAKNVNGLVLITFPKGNINAHFSEDTLSANVTFCEMMLVQNKSGEDVDINFSSDCAAQVVKPTKFNCKKGNSYVALRLNSNSSEIIVVDQRYVDDMLPLHVAMRVNRDIKSI